MCGSTAFRVRAFISVLQKRVVCEGFDILHNGLAFEQNCCQQHRQETIRILNTAVI